MKVLCDTSVIIPALWKWHPQHGICVDWLVSAASGRIELSVAAHSLAETFSVVTRLPARQRVPPDIAWQVIEATLLPHVKLVSVPAQDYQTVLSQLASRGIGGGVIYDALISVAAEIANVDLLLTMNISHFELIWPQGHGRIVSPQTTIAP